MQKYCSFPLLGELLECDMPCKDSYWGCCSHFLLSQGLEMQLRNRDVPGTYRTLSEAQALQTKRKQSETKKKKEFQYIYQNDNFCKSWHLKIPTSD